MQKYIWLIALTAIVLIIVFSKQIASLFGINMNGPTPPAEGSACTDTSGKAGTITGGVCTALGGPGNPSDPGGSDSALRSTSDLSFIYLPTSVNCSQYTASKPYSFNGCSYVYVGLYLSMGKRWCQLKKVSCP